jgi:transcription antitermination factor NusG
MALCERVRVLQIPGVACLVGFGRVLAALETEEIEALKKGLSGGVRGQPHPYLTVGRRVLVKHGPLAGLQGILLKRKCGLRLVVSVDLIRRSMAVEIDEADVEPL